MRAEMKMNQKFSFVRWLTTRDIEKIVGSLGLEVMTHKNNPDKKMITRYKNESGYHIGVFCRDLNKVETDMGLGWFIATPYDSEFNRSKNIVILNFDDFFLLEQLPAKSEDEAFEYNAKLTFVYQQYMKEKFGRHYIDMKRAHYQKLHQEVRAEKSEQAEVLNY